MTCGLHTSCGPRKAALRPSSGHFMAGKNLTPVLPGILSRSCGILQPSSGDAGLPARLPRDALPSTEQPLPCPALSRSRRPLPAACQAIDPYRLSCSSSGSQSLSFPVSEARCLPLPWPHRRPFPPLRRMSRAPSFKAGLSAPVRCMIKARQGLAKLLQKLNKCPPKKTKTQLASPVLLWQKRPHSGQRRWPEQQVASEPAAFSKADPTPGISRSAHMLP